MKAVEEMARAISKLLPLMTLFYVALLIVVSLLPSGGRGALARWDAAISPTWQDAGHVAAYALLAILVCRAMAAESTRLRMGLAASACSGFGGLLECGQAAVPGRTASLADVLANMAGVALGVAAVLLWKAVTRDRKAVGKVNG